MSATVHDEETRLLGEVDEAIEMRRRLNELDGWIVRKRVANRGTFDALTLLNQIIRDEILLYAQELAKLAQR